MKLTIDRRGATRLVTTKVLGRAGGRVETWRTLGTQMRRHALRLLGLLRRRRKTGAALGGTASHYSTKEVAWSMTDLRRLRLGRAVRVLAGATASLDFALELRNAVLVSRWRSVSCCCFLLACAGAKHQGGAQRQARLKTNGMKTYFAFIWLCCCSRE
jgi:hypothetical protein